MQSRIGSSSFSSVAPLESAIDAAACLAEKRISRGSIIILAGEDCGNGRVSIIDSSRSSSNQQSRSGRASSLGCLHLVLLISIVRERFPGGGKKTPPNESKFSRPTTFRRCLMDILSANFCPAQGGSRFYVES